VSDLHFGAADRAALAWFVDEVRARTPDAVVVTGDLTYRARAAEFAEASDWLRALAVPVSIEPGNHDLPYFNLWERFRDPYRRFRAVEAAVERPLVLADVEIVPMKTTARAQWRLNWAEGRVDRPSLAGAVARVRARGEGKLALVACHHPLVDLPTMQVAGRTAGGAQALQALADAGASAVLSGHVHDGFDVTHLAGERPIRLIGAGTLSERVRQTRPSYNLIEVAGAELQVEARLMAEGGSVPVPLPGDGATLSAVS
jgi:3',5'-cyclic AMP phosphodiesterase CpdA